MEVETSTSDSSDEFDLGDYRLLEMVAQSIRQEGGKGKRGGGNNCCGASSEDCYPRSGGDGNGNTRGADGEIRSGKTKHSC